MLDASCGDTCRGGGPSIAIAAPTATPVVTVAAAASETTTRPPSSVGVDVTATAVTTMAANVANDNTRYNPAVNVNGGPSPAALVDDADNGGAGNTSVQVAIVSVISNSNAAKSSLRAYFEGVNWPLNKALPKGAEFLNGPLGDIIR